ncbi:hypothetical protein [Thaumasiovibrio subtropicus]|uniref:hypothetical protein n=1 Tax=Thaumasiovibrio subtropicus TaxID=1891207 RepID=UPI000B35D650|nr:hypothetical protein [Thaumasiovibrio subtropicus]
MFTKQLLAFSVAAALVGCGSGSDSGTTAPTLAPKAKKVTAVLVDAATVEGVNYQCSGADGKGVTNAKGEFTVDDGASCTFDLDGFTLGQVDAVTQQNSVINTQALKPVSATKSLTRSSSADASYTARLSALLQSVDADGDFKNGIDVSQTDGETIQDDLLTLNDQAYREALKKVADLQGELLDDARIVTPQEAVELLTKQYDSDAVKDVITLLSDMDAGILADYDLESELGAIRNDLERNDGSNGYHRQTLLALLDVIEIVNTPAIANHIDVEGTHFEYSSTLPKLLDSTFNPNATFDFTAINGTSDELAALLHEAAKMLIDASARLGAAMPNDSYTLPYELLGGFDYQASLMVRATALQLANQLSVMAAYNFDDEEYVLPQTITLNALPVLGVWADRHLNLIQASQTIGYEGEYTLASADPVSMINNTQLFKLRTDPKYLATAKEAVVQSVSILEAINWDENVDTVAEINDMNQFVVNLKRHLNATDGNAVPLIIEADNTKRYVNLHAFYDVNKGIDRRVWNLNVDGYVCEVGAYSAELSKVMNMPVCGHDLDWVQNGMRTENPEHFQYIGNYYKENEDAFVSQFLQASPAAPNGEMTLNEARLNQVVWCGYAEGAKVTCEL